MSTVAEHQSINADPAMAETSDTLPACPRDLTPKQRAILDAASAVFLREGFERASVDVIAAEADVSKRTIYNHFADKRALFLAVIGYKLHPEGLLRALSSDRLHSPASVRGDLTTIGHLVVDQELDEDAAALRRVLIADIMRFPELTGACQQLLPFKAVQCLARRLHELMPERLSPEAAETALTQFLSMIAAQAQARSAFWSLPVTPELRTRFVNDAVDLIVRAYNLEN